jgi:hypothetical protein
MCERCYLEFRNFFVVYIVVCFVERATHQLRCELRVLEEGLRELAHEYLLASIYLFISSFLGERVREVRGGRWEEDGGGGWRRRRGDTSLASSFMNGSPGCCDPSLWNLVLKSYSTPMNLFGMIVSGQYFSAISTMSCSAPLYLIISSY